MDGFWGCEEGLGKDSLPGAGRDRWGLVLQQVEINAMWRWELGGRRELYIFCIIDVQLQISWREAELSRRLNPIPCNMRLSLRLYYSPSSLLQCSAHHDNPQRVHRFTHSRLSMPGRGCSPGQRASGHTCLIASQICL